MEEYDDRFETTVMVHGTEIDISVDKPVTDAELDLIVKRIEDNAELLWDRALRYFDSEKQRRGIEYIDDLSDPHFIADIELLSLWWCSDKGEEYGDAVIGVDFSVATLEPTGMTLGD